MGHIEELILVDNKEIPCPAGMEWVKDDVSGSDAGRTDDTLMHKNKQGEKRTLSLEWINLSKEEIHEVLVAFKPEYVNVTYWDPLIGDDVTKTFYTGRMKAKVRTWVYGRERYSSLNFDVIER